MKEVFAHTLLIVICCNAQIQAQGIIPVYNTVSPTNHRGLYRNQSPAYQQILNQQQQFPVQPQFLGTNQHQPNIQQRNSISEEPISQPNYDYNIYQPIPSYNTNSNRPTNEAELNQFGGPAPRPVIINPRPTQQPQQIHPDQPNLLAAPDQPYQTNGSYRPTNVPIDQNQSFINPTIPIRYSGNFDFITHFSWRLFQNSKRELSSTSNVVISPLSVQLLLSFIEQASAGATKRQLQTVIGNTSPLDIGQAVDKVTFFRSKNKLKIGSAMFASHRLSINQTLQEVAVYSKVDIIPVDFNNQVQTESIINNWAANSTNNKITNIFSGSQRNADLILTNAVYFDGAWKYPFNQTVDGPFLQGTQNKQVTFLKQTANLFYGNKNYKNLKIRWVELPYENDDFSMLILMPDFFKMDELIETVNEAYFTSLISDLESEEKRRVHLRLPKFEMEIRIPLKNILHSMGVADVFTADANIPYLATEKVKINDAQQDIYLKVDEKGTTAAAVTTFSVITLSSSSYDPEEITFDVNQPFLAVILHKQTKLPIFIAKIFNP